MRSKSFFYLLVTGLLVFQVSILISNLVLAEPSNNNELMMISEDISTSDNKEQNQEYRLNVNQEINDGKEQGITSENLNYTILQGSEYNIQQQVLEEKVPFKVNLKITDNYGTNIEDAQVYINNIHTNYRTDNNGEVTLNLEDQGNYKIMVFKVGFYPQDRNVLINNASTSIEFVLNTIAQPLYTVLHGVITNETDKSIIENVVVRVGEHNYLTDSNGHFMIVFPQEGTYNITIYKNDEFVALLDVFNIERGTSTICAKSYELTPFEEAKTFSYFFHDENLRAAIADKFKRQPNNIVTAYELTTVYALNADNRNIKNLEGIQNLTQLTNLNLNSNQISDLQPLSEMTNLLQLNIDNNQILNLEPLSNLNRISISAVGQHITLPNTSFIKNDVKITGLNGAVPNVSIMPSGGKYHAEEGYVEWAKENQNILKWDFLPETHFSGTVVQMVETLNKNHILYQHRLPEVIMNGSSVEKVNFHYITTPELIKAYRITTQIPGTDQTVSRKNITDKIQEVDLRDYPINNSGIGIPIVSEIEIYAVTDFEEILVWKSSDFQETKTFSYLFEDENLAKAVAHVFGRQAEDLVTVSELNSVNALIADNKNIKSLDGIHRLTGLNTLSLNSNQINDLEPLRGLKKLSKLSIDNNQILNIEPLIELYGIDLSALNQNVVLPPTDIPKNHVIITGRDGVHPSISIKSNVGKYNVEEGYVEWYTGGMNVLTWSFHPVTSFSGTIVQSVQAPSKDDVLNQHKNPEVIMNRGYVERVIFHDFNDKGFITDYRVTTRAAQTDKTVARKPSNGTSQEVDLRDYPVNELGIGIPLIAEIDIYAVTGSFEVWVWSSYIS